MRKTILEDDGGQVGILASIGMMIAGFAILLVGSYVVFAVFNTTDTDAKASQTLTITGNVSNGERINITNPITNGNYVIEINTTAGSTPIVCQISGCIAVNLSYDGSNRFNESYWAANNISVAINGNATLAALLTADIPQNGTTSKVRITADSFNTYTGAGVTDYNRIQVSETLDAASWGDITLKGGTYEDATNNRIKDYVIVVFPLFGLVLMLFGFAILLNTIKVLGGEGTGR